MSRFLNCHHHCVVHFCLSALYLCRINTRHCSVEYTVYLMSIVL